MAAGVDAPENLSQAHQSLAKFFSVADRERIRKMRSEEEMNRFIGMPGAIALTNEWQLWADPPLARYFKRLGINEPHDMVGIVTQTYWCKLHQQPFGLRAKVAKIRAYYARHEAMQPPDKNPRDGMEIDWFITHSNPPAADLYLGVSKSHRSFWRYDHSTGRGIEPALPDEAKEIQSALESVKEFRH